jgi:rhodanese-related sulfurtransferase
MWAWPFGGAPEFSAQHVHELLEARKTGTQLPDEHPLRMFRGGVRLIDVRTEGEYAGGHIDGAESVSLTSFWNFRSRLEELKLSKDAEQLNLCICLSAHRSVSAVNLLREMGFENAFQLQGGMQAWRAANLPEVKQ